MRRFFVLIPAFLTAGALFAQTGASPQFEVASVRPSPPGPLDQVSIGVHVDGARFSCNSLSLRDYFRMAYKVKDYQIVAPEWMSSERFDISATLPAGATQNQVPDMIQVLLADRFRLKFHRESREFPVYGLVVAKGGWKLKESPPDTEGSADAKTPVNVTASGSRAGVSVSLGHGSWFSLADNKFEAKKMNMASFAESLARFEDKPVIDMTGMTGVYDVSLNLTDEDYRALLIRSAINAGVTLPPGARQAMEMASGDSFSGAMQAAGLKLESRKAPLDVLVIDESEKTPSAN